MCFIDITDKCYSLSLTLLFHNEKKNERNTYISLCIFKADFTSICISAVYLRIETYTHNHICIHACLRTHVFVINYDGVDITGDKETTKITQENNIAIKRISITMMTTPISGKVLQHDTNSIFFSLVLFYFFLLI